MTPAPGFPVIRLTDDERPGTSTRAELFDEHIQRVAMHRIAREEAALMARPLFGKSRRLTRLGRIAQVTMLVAPTVKRQGIGLLGALGAAHGKAWRSA